MGMNKTTVFTVVLVALVVVAGVQAIQLVGLNGKLADGQVSLSAQSTTPIQSSAPSGGVSRVTTPSNIQNLPKMVGGC